MTQALKAALLLFISFSLVDISSAGESIVISPLKETEEEKRNWCDAFDRIGAPLYKNRENPFLQRLDVFGRVHWQYAEVDGEDVNGDDFKETFDEWRRIRLGVEARFLQYFTLNSSINLMEDDRPRGGNSDFGYRDFNQIRLTTDLGELIGTGGLDSLKLLMGRMKFNFSQEAHTSSRRIKTVERSAISNKAFNSGRGTGILLEAEKGKFSLTAGIYGDQDTESLGGFSNGLTYYGSLEFEPSRDTAYLLDVAINDSDDDSKADFLEYEWAVSLAGIHEFGDFEFMWNAIYGDNRGEGVFGGHFYGLVLMPSYWLVEKKLEAVVRYQYQGAEEDEGIRLNSRYLRRADEIQVADLDRSRGDEHHSIYAGLNWHLCRHKLKLMLGVEYEELEAPGSNTGDAEATTYWLAARTYF